MPRRPINSSKPDQPGNVITFPGSDEEPSSGHEEGGDGGLSPVRADDCAELSDESELVAIRRAIQSGCYEVAAGELADRLLLGGLVDPLADDADGTGSGAGRPPLRLLRPDDGE